jgi:hypothetical protein
MGSLIAWIAVGIPAAIVGGVGCAALGFSILDDIRRRRKAKATALAVQKQLLLERFAEQRKRRMDVVSSSK